MTDDATAGPRWVLRLFVAGHGTNSQSAIRNLQRICRTELNDRADVEIIDLYESPALANEFQIVAAPTLEKLAPSPFRRLIGDLSDTPRVLAALGIVLGDGDES